MVKTSNKNKITTIKLEKNTKSRLDSLKEHHRESYEEVITKMLNIINITIRNPVTGANIFRRIKQRKNKKQQVYQEHNGHQLEKENNSDYTLEPDGE